MTLGQSQVRLLTIHEFAKVCRTTPRTLRFYDKKGIFKPVFIDPYTKYRFYDPQQARSFLKIKLLQNFHVPLKNIKINTTEKVLADKLIALRKEIQEKEKEYKFLEKIKTFLFKSNGRDSIFQTKTFGPYNLFCMKVEHGEYAKINDCIKIIWKEAKRLKLKCKNHEIVFYLKHDYNPKNTPLEIALICELPLSLSHLSSGSTKKENFYFKKYPKTKVLAFEYNGPHDYFILVYQKLYSYFKDYAGIKGYVFDLYKKGPLNTKSPYDYQTTIGFPI